LIPSIFQQAVYDHISSAGNHLFIDAVAGSGKTTTVVKALELLPDKSILFLAFNKSIAEELQRRVPPNVEAKTLSSFGYGLLRQIIKGRIKLDNYKVSNALQSVLGVDWKDKESMKLYYKLKTPICKIIDLMKGSYPEVPDINDLIEKHDIDIPEEDAWLDYYQATWEKTRHDLSVIDFNDMLYLPVAFDCKFPQYDYVFVDEAQDLNTVQIEMISRLKDQGATIVAVGDKHQAIYGFRGSDAEAVDRLISRLNMNTLPLSVCYRCDSKIIAEAQKIVPHITYRDDALEGTVEHISTEYFQLEVEAGDYVICRTTAPLVKRCFNQIRLGRKATVLGRDLGESIINTIIKKITEDNLRTVEFLPLLEAWHSDQLTKLSAANRDTSVLDDKVEVIQFLAMDVSDVDRLILKIKEIFSDSKEGIIFCTGHKSKGLEADTVYFLRPDLCPHPKAKKSWQIVQEHNLRYVIITRAKHNLYFVDKEKDEK
jgi:DNA helicase-2/ATP-dependent DNA helicase PcrA